MLHYMKKQNCDYEIVGSYRPLVYGAGIDSIMIGDMHAQQRSNPDAIALTYGTILSLRHSQMTGHHCRSYQNLSGTSQFEGIPS